MATKQIPARETAAPPVKAAAKLKKFEIPDEIPAEFNVASHTETFVQGYVETADVRALLDEFGLHDRRVVVFPFQHIKRQHGETWAMRIEPEAGHSKDGIPFQAHSWVFHRQQPEVTGSEN